MGLQLIWFRYHMGLPAAMYSNDSQPLSCSQRRDMS
jgi:hypothetical protein